MKLESFKNTGVGLFGFGIVLCFIGYLLMFIALPFGERVIGRISLPLLGLGAVFILISIPLTLMYVIKDRVKQDKEDDLGDHTKY